MCSFDYASAFTGDLSDRYVAKVTDITGMVYGAPTFNGDPSKRYVAKVTDMTCLVLCCFNLQW